MVELAPLDNYQGSDPDLLVFNIHPSGVWFPGDQVDLFVTTKPAVWRLRFLNAFLNATGTVNATTITLGGYTSSLIGDPWPAGGPLNAGCPMLLNKTIAYNVTWSTEVADNYIGKDSPFGDTSMMGLPLLFLPHDTSIVFAFGAVGASDFGVNILGGTIQIEKFPPSVLSGVGQGSQENVYLLPQTI